MVRRSIRKRNSIYNKPAKIAVLKDIYRAQKANIKSPKKGFWNIFVYNRHTLAYVNYFVHHAKWLRDHGYIKWDPRKKQWVLTKKGLAVIKNK